MTVTIKLEKYIACFKKSYKMEHVTMTTELENI